MHIAFWWLIAGLTGFIFGCLVMSIYGGAAKAKLQAEKDVLEAQLAGFRNRAASMISGKKIG